MYRILKVYTPSYSYSKYKKLKNLYQSNIKEAHKRLLKFKTKLLSNNSTNKILKPIFYAELIGLDNTVKYTFKTVNNSTFKTLFNKIDEMPLGHLRPNTKKAGLSLYTDYNPKKTLKGTGFKDAETAKRTLKLISNRDLTYQKQVVNTMYNRAKFHPHQTTSMKEAMDIYFKWLLKHNNLLNLKKKY
jgi:hypothetical protein